jgi:hypothetical protein
MPLTPASIALQFPQTRYHPAEELITWHPVGLLDDELLDKIMEFIRIQEEIEEAPPFDRFADLSHLTSIRLQLGHVFKIAAERTAASRGRRVVKSAIVCDKVVGFGIARMYETLMEGSSIQVRAFRDRAAAAEWLAVPLEALSEDEL